MVARVTRAAKKPTADMGWERGHTSGIEDRRVRRAGPSTPGWQGPPAPPKSSPWPDQTGGRGAQVGNPGYSTPRQPGPIAHAPGYTRGHGGLPRGPGDPPGPKVAVRTGFQTPQATTGRGVQPQSAFRTPQATTGRGIKPLNAKPAVKIKKVAGSPKARAVAKNTGNVAGRRKT